MTRFGCLFLLIALGACSSSGDDNASAANSFSPPTVIDRQDYLRHITLRFHRLDANGDGVIERDELPVKHADRITRYDADHDGRVTWQEYRDGAMARFDKADADHDGALTSAEQTAGDFGD